MILAAAQARPKPGDIEGNLDDHYRLIEMASGRGAGLIVFPEMSLTGYEREEALKLAFSENDPRLDNLRQMAVDSKMIIVAGAPIMINTALFIGAFILRPDGSISIYTKQFLHPGEEAFFKSSFDYNPTIELARERISLAICADIDHPSHPENAAKAKSTIYLASIFFTPSGTPAAHDLLSGYAKKHSLHVLMSNYCGKSWGIDAGGKSAFWDKNGRRIAELSASDPGLLIVEKRKDTWKGQTLRDE